VDEAPDGPGALEKMNHRHFDVVIVDLFMPG